MPAVGENQQWFLRTSSLGHCRLLICSPSHSGGRPIQIDLVELIIAVTEPDFLDLGSAQGIHPRLEPGLDPEKKAAPRSVIDDVPTLNPLLPLKTLSHGHLKTVETLPGIDLKKDMSGHRNPVKIDLSLAAQRRENPLDGAHGHSCLTLDFEEKLPLMKSG